jgi:hypothetical protein
VGPASCCAAGAEGSSGGIMWKEKEEKESYPPTDTSLQVQTDKHNSPCKEIPAGVGSSDLFTQRDDLCGQLHVVYPGRYNHFCRSVPVERRLI